MKSLMSLDAYLHLMLFLAFVGAGVAMTLLVISFFVAA